MPRRTSKVRITDVKRAIEAVRSAGVEIGRVEFDDGRIIVVPGKPLEPNQDAKGRRRKQERMATV